jgi:phosphopantothenoylcysteine decarboxylase/phosphopantothenate--cysteine ligase
MWGNAATQRNVTTLRVDGVTVLGPDSGDQACGEVGDGRMVEPEAIHQWLQGLRASQVLAGKRMLLTAGPTFESIDPVRGITNTSSGKMGYALAQAAAEAGASVTMVSGPTSLATPAGVSRVDVVSAAQMAAAVDTAIDGSDIFVGVAAVADYTPELVSDRKIKKNGKSMSLSLKPTADILALVASRKKPPFCVGFAAESHDVEKFAEDKRRRKNLPLVIANRAQDAMGSDSNEVVLLDDRGAHPLPRMDKLSLARRLVVEIAARLPK